MPKTIRSNANSKNYKFPESTNLMRPEIGTQAQFKKHKPRKKYRYDDSLSPVMAWDGQNPAREQGEMLIRQALEAKTLDEAKLAASRLKAISKPFLNWAGKAERFSFEVPTLPLFIHERLSTKAILETLKGHRFDRNQATLLDLWGDPQHSITDQVLRAYEHKDDWVNRMILGDSLTVMNSLLHFEGLGGQVQMIYIDPPYGVKFGSNFQPFVRKRDVSHNDDQDMTREPEMVQAYRDTWEFGLHSYLTYMRDRLTMARELLTPAGSIFVQISDENLHHVREVMDEVFGKENFCGVIAFSKTTSATSDLLPSTNDFLLWYARDVQRVKYKQIYLEKQFGGDGASAYTRVELPDGTRRALSAKEKGDLSLLPPGSRIYRIDNLTSQRPPGDFPVQLNGRTFKPRRGYWKTGEAGMERLKAAKRLEATEGGLYYVRYVDDFPVYPLTNLWSDTSIAGFASDKLYVVQTTPKVVKRCILMTTDPGDLVLDPTCGSGTTAYVAEEWGRRWITIDTSRVPLALARQRLLTATFPWFELQDDSRGPVSGFVYKRRRNKKGDEVGGIVPHVTLKSIANNEQSKEEVLVDRPEDNSLITRVTGPFCFEATIPTPQESDETESSGVQQEQNLDTTFSVRMLEVLRRSPVLRLEGNKQITLKSVRAPARTLSLSAEAIVTNGADKPVSFLFGPENGAVSEKLVYEAAREAHAKSYSHLYVIGFAIEPNARTLIEKAAEVVGLSATYVQATPDLMMGDLLKSMRSSQIFSVCGLPDIELRRLKSKGNGSAKQYEVELLGLDVFDPVEMINRSVDGNNVPAWFIDTDYNGKCFLVGQAFFPRTGAWENLKKALRSDYEESVWQHLSGNISTPFEAGAQGQVAIKVIDDRGNELMVVKNLTEAK